MTLKLLLFYMDFLILILLEISVPMVNFSLTIYISQNLTNPKDELHVFCERDGCNFSFPGGTFRFTR